MLELSKRLRSDLIRFLTKVWNELGEIQKF